MRRYHTTSARMKTALLVLGLAATAFAASSVIVPVKNQKIQADTIFLKRQKQILDHFVGIGQNEFFHNEWSDYEIDVHIDDFIEPDVVRRFVEVYKQGILPVDGVFSMASPVIKKQTIMLFDVFFFAKDFETFYKAASWARRHIHPIQFVYAYIHAIVHREDCQNIVIPPIYEIIPTYFVPQDVIQKIYNKNMFEGIFVYNNNGYVNKSIGVVDIVPIIANIYPPHIDNKISYITEDVGINSYYIMWNIRYPSWMSPIKYKKSIWVKMGEGFYYTHQQIYARYMLERIVNGLPFVENLYWDRPIKVGYVPRIKHVNGIPFVVRPDNIVPIEINDYYVKKAQIYESRLYEAIDQGAFWFNNTMVQINNVDGIDILGKFMYGFAGMPNINYFGNYYQSSIEALAYMVQSVNDVHMVGGVVSDSISALRDPVFYMYLNRMINIFQWHKKNIQVYTKNELILPGVDVVSVDVGKIVTYFEKFDYEVTNAVPVVDIKEYSSLKYIVRQDRLNHKPFTYKIVINSDKIIDGMVRVFIGPKYDSENHVLTIEQKRLLMVEIDRFPVKLVSGQNVIERDSVESPIFSSEPVSMRQLYSKIISAINNQEPYYINEKVSCGVPIRLQIPVGSRNGQEISMVVVVTPIVKTYGSVANDVVGVCGSSVIYDQLPFGYPFDRPIENVQDYIVPNIYYKDIIVYHRDVVDVVDVNHIDQIIY